MTRTLLARASVVGPALAIGGALSALAALGVASGLGWKWTGTFEVWASVLAGPFAGIWASATWQHADAAGWSVGCLVAMAAHPLRAGCVPGVTSAIGVGVWVFLGFALTYDGV